jgi:hypothetical protein
VNHNQDNVLKKAMVLVILSIKSLVVSSLITVLLYGIKWAILVNWSTITKNESKALELGRFVMKSIDIETKVSLKLAVGVITQTDDDKEPWNGNICGHICFHQKSCDISSMVLLKPKCPVVEKS